MLDQRRDVIDLAPHRVVGVVAAGTPAATVIVDDGEVRGEEAGEFLVSERSASAEDTRITVGPLPDRSNAVGVPSLETTVDFTVAADWRVGAMLFSPLHVEVPYF
ncbi:hypothetical protein GCM10011583_54700 [Streptomyces camponoticapitis]|uniref:Uncharacterized protein n=1 Tax=Streptomyces camponoticapitis TaxID=1616125 RepID=A0ABQ2ELZ5_9ACTN|nr:hypothetical protein GCM10011583_54700 [Streptomyces camponoticapitis]